jgi:hypothetical protein
MVYERRRNTPISREFPREIYRIWLAMSIWGFCASGFTALVMAIISLLIAVAVGLASLVALATRRRHARDSEPPGGSFQRWLGDGSQAHTGRLSAAAAAIQVILPLAAVSFGMTLFAVVRHLDVLRRLSYAWVRVKPSVLQSSLPTP